MSGQKRSDLQGIRGIAIFSVILFHFFPDQFPNGYIGVDQFFVLSGYLIAMVLNREKSINMESMRLFYYRRIKRIVPLYVLVILLILVFLRYFLPDDNFDSNVSSAWSALVFTTNLRGDDPEMAYAKLLALAIDAFAHTWSLAVEMQFYVLVPVIFYFLCRTSLSARYYAMAVIVTISCVFQLFIFDDYMAFNSVFARLWQFSIGISSFLVTVVENKNDGPEFESLVQHETVRERTNMLDYRTFHCFIIYSLGLSILVSFASNQVPPMFLRLAVTLLTGVTMICGTRVQSVLVSNRVFVYLGDISYSLYLVHWPIYTYVKLMYPQSHAGLLAGIVCSFLVAVLLTETYEKAYLAAGKQSIAIIIVALYSLCVIVLIIANIEQKSVLTSVEKVSRKHDLNLTIDQVIEQNNAAVRNDNPSLYLKICKYGDGKGPYNWCEFKNLPKTGKNKIMIMGNSYAPNSAPIIYENCKSKASNMTMYSITACEALLQTPLPNCNNWYKKFFNGVREVKPDVLFMIFRYGLFFQPLKKNQRDDHLLNAQARLKEYQSVVSKKIFILNAIPQSNTGLSRIVNKLWKKKEKIDQKTLRLNADADLARRRMREMIKVCSKCELIDYVPPLTVNGTYNYFDESTGLTYFTNSMHLSPHGLDTVDPVYQKVCSAL